MFNWFKSKKKLIEENNELTTELLGWKDKFIQSKREVIKLEKEKIVLNAVLKTTELELKNLQERQRPKTIVKVARGKCKKGC